MESLTTPNKDDFVQLLQFVRDSKSYHEQCFRELQALEDSIIALERKGPEMTNYSNDFKNQMTPRSNPRSNDFRNSISDSSKTLSLGKQSTPTPLGKQSTLTTLATPRDTRQNCLLATTPSNQHTPSLMATTPESTISPIKVFPSPAKLSKMKKVTVLFDFEAENPNELSSIFYIIVIVSPGQIIYVEKEIDSGWWMVFYYRV
jgi:hypothetical protein